MLRLVWGEHTAEHAIEFVQSLDKTCATRWLSYFHPTVDLSKVVVTEIPGIKRAFDEKRRELFGAKPEPYAIVCGSEAVRLYFEFWSRYSGSDERVFSSLDEAFDWLGLSEATRAVASHTLERWAADAEVGDLGVGRSQAGPPEPGARQAPDLPAR
jgi:hypothetical protein